MIVEGAISVKAVIQQHKRTVKEVYIAKDKRTKDFNYIRKIARQEGIPLKELSREELGDQLSGHSHGGVGAQVGERKEDELSDGDIFFLDGIEDPFNLGYSLRTLYALGIRNVLLDERDRRLMESQLLKSSAGAYDMLNIRTLSDPLGMIKELKEKGYQVYGLYRGPEAEDIFETVFACPALFILGGEKRGIAKEILGLCDKQLYIAYGSDFRNALNACGALDVTATLLFRQRKKK